MAIYDQYVKDYGGLQQYSDAIKRKKAAGETLSDPGAASAFATDNPGIYYGSNNAGGNPYSMETIKALGSLRTPTAYRPTAYTPSAYNMPSREQFLAMAQGQYEPLRQAARSDITQQYADLRNRLPGLLNARGQVYGGLRNASEMQLTEEQAKALGGVNLQYDSQIAALANQLQQRAEDVAYRQGEQGYQQYLGGQQLGLQAAQFNQGAEQNSLANQLALIRMGSEQYNADRGYGLQEKQFGLQQRGQDWTERLGEAGLTGYDPKTGNMTMTARQLEAGLTGIDPVTGQKTMTFQEFLETQRHNKAAEGLSSSQLGEAIRHNKAVEAKTENMSQGQRARLAEQMQKIKDTYNNQSLTVSDVLNDLERDRFITTMEYGDPSMTDYLKKYAEQIAPDWAKRTANSKFLPNTKINPASR